MQKECLRLNRKCVGTLGLTFYIWLTGNPESLNQIYNSYDKVTSADIMRAAEKYFVPQHLTISTISSQKEGGIK